jgi:hypothetical protein
MESNITVQARCAMLSSYSTALLVAGNLLLSLVLSYSFTKFPSPDVVLSTSSWGAGVPSSTHITAFATLRRWWVFHEPEAAIAPVLLGAIFPRLRTPRALLTYNCCYFLVLLAWPNREKFLTTGLIDSSLANTFAVLGAYAFTVLLLCVWRLTEPIPGAPERPGPHSSRRVLQGSKQLPNWLGKGFLRSPKMRIQFGILVASSLFLGFCPLVRGEFIVLYAFVFALSAVVFGCSRRSTLPFLTLSIVLFVLPSAAYGAVNAAVFGRYVPLRMQGGQNLFEPIGQFPNPYGIQFDDVWVSEYLEQNGYEYLTFEADEFLTARYLEILREHPHLLVSNFFGRLEFFSGFFKLPINLAMILLALSGVVVFGLRDMRLFLLSIPLALAIAYMLFFGWTNKLPRLITPIHMLVNMFWCFLFTYLIVYAPKWRGRRVAERGRLPV